MLRRLKSQSHWNSPGLSRKARLRSRSGISLPSSQQCDGLHHPSIELERRKTARRVFASRNAFRGTEGLFSVDGLIRFCSTNRFQCRGSGGKNKLICKELPLHSLGLRGCSGMLFLFGAETIRTNCRRLFEHVGVWLHELGLEFSWA